MKKERVEKRLIRFIGGGMKGTKSRGSSMDLHRYIKKTK